MAMFEKKVDASGHTFHICHIRSGNLNLQSIIEETSSDQPLLILSMLDNGFRRGEPLKIQQRDVKSIKQRLFENRTGSHVFENSDGMYRVEWVHHCFHVSKYVGGCKLHVPSCIFESFTSMIRSAHKLMKLKDSKSHEN